MVDRLLFVLVSPQHPGNVGAAARAIKTMGFSRLALVTPQCDPCSPEAVARASGAADLLHAAPVFATLDEALAEVTLSAAFTSRSREYATPFLTPEAFAEAAHRTLSRHPTAQVALVFGNEARGLSNEAVWRCTHPVAIPANPAYPSLNLAAAVQIAAYVLARILTTHPLPRAVVPEPDQVPCTQAEVEGVVAHFLRVAAQVGFYDPQTPKRLEARLRRFLARARLERAEANLMRGLFKACAQAAARNMPGAADSVSGSATRQHSGIIEQNSQE